LAFVFVILSLLAPSKALHSKKSKELGCGEIKGHFRGRFWHFYQRGRSWAACKMWDKAESDFREAIKQRQADQVMAKTYGLHFIDYFPHRELGITLFKQGRIHEALKELEKSYEHEPSARAAFYLNEVHRTLLKKSGGDSIKPAITIASPVPGAVTSEFKLKVKGEVWDRGRVASIEVNGKAAFFELAEKEKTFKIEVPLERGDQTIRVVAEDLMGNLNVATASVKVDRDGPQLIIERVDTPRPGVRSVRGVAVDPSGIASLKLAGKKLSIRPGREVAFHQEVEPGPRGLVFEAVDLVGNRTRGNLDKTRAEKTRGTWNPPPTRYASLGMPPGFVTIHPRPILLVQASGPVIEMKGFQEEQTVYLDRVVVEGKVSSDKSVTNIKVQDKPILQKPGRLVYFSTMVPLEAGENIVKVAAQDQAGKRSEDRAKIKRVVPKVHDVGSRYSLSVMPLACPEGSPHCSIIQSKLLHHLSVQGRFALVERERLEDVLSEMKLSQEILVDPETAVQAGKLVAAAGMIFGEIHQGRDSIEVVARLVDTETGQILLSRDVYAEPLDLKLIDSLCERLAWKFLQAYPLLEGFVIKVSGNTIITDLGSSTGVIKNMQVIVFEMGEEIIHPVTGESLGADTNELGSAVLVSVEQKFSKAEIKSPEKSDEIKTGMKVITR